MAVRLIHGGFWGLVGRAAPLMAARSVFSGCQVLGDRAAPQNCRGPLPASAQQGYFLANCEALLRHRGWQDSWPCAPTGQMEISNMMPPVPLLVRWLEMAKMELTQGSSHCSLLSSSCVRISEWSSFIYLPYTFQSGDFMQVFDQVKLGPLKMSFLSPVVLWFS